MIRNATALAGISRLLLLLLCSLLGLVPSADAKSLVGKGEVRAAGRDAAKEIEKKEGLYPNAQAQARVRRIGDKLARLAKYQEGTVFAFQVLDMEEINAFALPSGHIYVTRGLLDAVGKNDDLLAAVIGHEIGHLAELHAFRRVEKVLRQALAFTALDLLFGKRLGKDAQYVAALTESYLAADYSQDQETEADRYGVILATEAGYDPSAMADFLRLLAEKEKSLGLLKYLHSHPPSKDRAKRVDAFVANYAQESLDRFLYPTPPEAAFTYQYPDFMELERQARKAAEQSKKDSAAKKKKDKASDKEPTRKAGV